MGITGLIPFLEKASSKINIRDVKGYTVAIDTYCWLHKGAFACADKLIRGEQTDIHIQYCIKYVNLLLTHNIKPILVFDGRHLPAKALTEKRRREARNDSKKRAAELLRLGKTEEAKSHMRRCVDITHEMALQLIQECRKRNVDCIVAPYEADAQLAFLNKHKIAQYIITEDSDLVLFGCEKIIFKLDLNGNCLLVDAGKLHLAMGCRLEKFTFNKFRYMCILSGCDYLDSLPGIGLAKACKFVLKTEETDMTKALKKLPQYLNLRNIIVTEDYIQNFLKAEATFKHMFVYNPLIRQMVRLNNTPEDIVDYELFCTNAGDTLDNETAFQLALGNLHPFSFKQLDNWHPDQHLNNRIKTDSWSQSNKTKHKSIWQPLFETHLPKPQNTINAFLFKKIKYKTDEHQTNDEQGKNCESEISIVSLYTDNDKEPANKRQRQSNNITDGIDDKTAIVESKNHNPFVKCTLTENSVSPALITTESSSLLKTLSPIQNFNRQTIDTKQLKLSKFKRTILRTDNKDIKSRFFISNTILVKSSNSTEAMNIDKKDFGKIVTDIESSGDKNNEKLIAFYSPTKINEKNKTENLKACDIEKPRSLSLDLKNNDNDLILTSSQKENNTTILDNFEMKDGNVNKRIDIISSDEVIVISDSEAKTKPILGKTKKNIRIGLTRKSKIKYEDPKIQTRLSKFGFKKKPSILS